MENPQTPMKAYLPFPPELGNGFESSNTLSEADYSPSTPPPLTPASTPSTCDTDTIVSAPTTLECIKQTFVAAKEIVSQASDIVETPSKIRIVVQQEDQEENVIPPEDTKLAEDIIPAFVNTTGWLSLRHSPQKTLLPEWASRYSSNRIELTFSGGFNAKLTATRPNITTKPDQLGVDRRWTPEAGETIDNALHRRLHLILPIDTLKRMGEDRLRCVADTRRRGPNARCKNTLKKWLATATVNDFVAGIAESCEIGAMLAQLERLLPNVLCSGSHMGVAKTKIEEVRKELETDSKVSTRTSFTIKSWLEALKRIPSKDEQLSDLTSSDQDSRNNTGTQASSQMSSLGAHSSVSAKSENSSYLNIARNVQHMLGPPVPNFAGLDSNFSPFSRSLRWSTMAVNEVLREVLYTPLRPKDTKSGYLYVYWRKGKFGLVKIGYTTQTTEKRLEQWKRQCGHESEQCCVKDLSFQKRVMNARRLEDLVHAELKEYRVRETGCRCASGIKKTGNHNEWFCIQANYVEKVRNKWTHWINEKPRYENQAGGILLESELSAGEIEYLCTPLVMDNDSTLSPHRDLRSRRSSSNRSARDRRKSSSSMPSFKVEETPPFGESEIKIEAGLDDSADKSTSKP